MGHGRLQQPGPAQPVVQPKPTCSSRDRAFNQQLNQHLQQLAREQCKPVTLERMVRGYWWRAPLIFVCFHVIRHFPRIAGWFPAHRQHLRSVQPEEGTG